jgi:2-methylisocitrate lyase-like PEP mutase family enzyme
MKILLVFVALLAALWGFSSILTSRVQLAYSAGFRDGKNAFTIDSQCSAWLMNSDLKEAKSRICGK